MIFLNKNLYFNLIILPLIMFSSFISLSISDSFTIWFILELNNFLFISFLLFNNSNKKMIFFYFIIQMISSSILIIIFSLNFIIISNIFMIFISSSLMLKLNIPPLHLWALMIINNLNWYSILILLSIQKIIPLYLLSFFIFNSFIFYFFIFNSLIIPPLMMINLTNFKKIFLYSSMNHSSWFILLILLKNLIWFIYLMFYSMIMFILIKLINLTKFNFNLKIFYSKINLSYIFLFMNLASLPPFSFFLFKWYNLFIFLNFFNFNFILFMLMINSLILIYIYINMTNLSLYYWLYSYKFINMKIYSFMNTLTFLILFSSIFFIIIYDFKLLKTMNLQSLKLYFYKILIYFFIKFL